MSAKARKGKQVAIAGSARPTPRVAPAAGRVERSLAPEEDDRPVADVAAETRTGKLAGATGLASLVALVAALIVGATGALNGTTSEDDRKLLVKLHEKGDAQVLGAGLRALGLLLLIVITIYLAKAITARKPSHHRAFKWCGIASFVILAACTVIGAFELRDVANQFHAQADQSAKAASKLLDDKGSEPLLRGATIGEGFGGLLFGIWLAITSLDAMRVGLLSRFLVVFGIGAGAATALGLSAGQTLFWAWLGSVSVLALGYWPGGRPKAWETGQAESWSALEADALAERRAAREARKHGQT